MVARMKPPWLKRRRDYGDEGLASINRRERRPDSPASRPRSTRSSASWRSTISRIRVASLFTPFEHGQALGSGVFRSLNTAVARRHGFGKLPNGGCTEFQLAAQLDDRDVRALHQFQTQLRLALKPVRLTVFGLEHFEPLFRGLFSFRYLRCELAGYLRRAVCFGPQERIDTQCVVERALQFHNRLKAFGAVALRLPVFTRSRLDQHIGGKTCSDGHHTRPVGSDGQGLSQRFRHRRDRNAFDAESSSEHAVPDAAEACHRLHNAGTTGRPRRVMRPCSAGIYRDHRPAVCGGNVHRAGVVAEVARAQGDQAHQRGQFFSAAEKRVGLIAGMAKQRCELFHLGSLGRRSAHHNGQPGGFSGGGKSFHEARGRPALQLPSGRSQRAAEQVSERLESPV